LILSTRRRRQKYEKGDSTASQLPFSSPFIDYKQLWKMMVVTMGNICKTLSFL